MALKTVIEEFQKNTKRYTPQIDQYIDLENGDVDLARFFDEHKSYKYDYRDLYDWRKDGFGTIRVDSIFRRGWLEYAPGMRSQIDDDYHAAAVADATGFLSEFGYSFG